MGWGQWGKVGKGHRKGFWAVDDVMSLNLNVGYTALSVCENISSCILIRALLCLGILLQ